MDCKEISLQNDALDIKELKPDEKDDGKDDGKDEKIRELLGYLPYLENFLKDKPKVEGDKYTHIDLKKIKVINWATFSNFEIDFEIDIKKVYIIGPSDSGKTNLIRSVQHLFQNKYLFTHTNNTEGNSKSEISLFITTKSNSNIMGYIKDQVSEIFKDYVLSKWLERERETLNNNFEFLKKFKGFIIDNKNLQSFYLLGKMLLPSNLDSDYSKIINNVEILNKEIESEFNKLWGKVNKKEYEIQFKLQMYEEESGKEKLIGNVLFGEEYIPIGDFFKQTLSLVKDNKLTFTGSIDGAVDIEVQIEDVFKENSMPEILNLIQPEIAILPRDEGLLQTTMQFNLPTLKRLELSIIGKLDMSYTLLRVLNEIGKDDLERINKLSKTTLQVEFYKQDGNVGFTKNGKTFSLNDSSGSVLHSLILFYTLTRKKSIYILDEPVSMWHPSIHFRFNEIIDDLIKSSNEYIKIIIITHVPTLLNINSTFHEQSHLFRFCVCAGSTKHHRADIKSLIQNKNSLEALGMVTFTHSLFYEYNILVEGKLDLNYLNTLKDMVTPENKLFEVLKFSNIIPLNGCKNIGLDQFFKTFQLPFTKLKDLDVITFKEKDYPKDFSNYREGDQNRTVQNLEDLEKLIEFTNNCEDNKTKNNLQKKIYVAEYYQKKINSQGNNHVQLELELMKQMKYNKFPYKSIADHLSQITFNDFNEFSFTVRKLIRTNINEWIWKDGTVESAFLTNVHVDQNTAISAVKKYLENKNNYPDINNFLNYIHAKFYMWKSFGENRISYEGYSIIRFKLVSDCDPSSLIELEEQTQKKFYNFHSFTHKKEKKRYAWYLYFPVKTGEKLGYEILINRKYVTHSTVKKVLVDLKKESFITHKIEIRIFPNKCLTVST